MLMKERQKQIFCSLLSFLTKLGFFSFFIQPLNVSLPLTSTLVVLKLSEIKRQKRFFFSYSGIFPTFLFSTHSFHNMKNIVSMRLSLKCYGRVTFFLLNFFINYLHFRYWWFIIQWYKKIHIHSNTCVDFRHYLKEANKWNGYGAHSFDHYFCWVRRKTDKEIILLWLRTAELKRVRERKKERHTTKNIWYAPFIYSMHACYFFFLTRTNRIRSKL